MSQNSGCCDCDSYALQTANVGIAAINNANTALTGAGAIPVFTATDAFDGSIIKSIRIKAIMPVTAGMVRLFVGNNDASLISLYKEIPIPVTPVLDATPTPFPLLPTFEMVLNGGLKLQPNYKLYATTQNSQAFNIITEGLDWKYPATLPDSCFNYKQETAFTGLGNISSAITSLAPPPASITTIFTAPASINGAFVKTITIKALQPTSVNGAVRLFIGNGTISLLFQEIMVPQTDQSGYEPSFKVVVDLNMNINTGFTIGATTQLTESFAITVEAVDWVYGIS